MNTRPKPQTNQQRPNRPSYGRSSVLAAWRGVDLSEEEKLRRYRPKTAASLTKNLIERLNLKQKESETEIPKVWASSIDPRVTAHAQPTGLRNGTLFVTVDNSVWLHEIIRYHKREILSRLRNSFGEKAIQRISFRLG
jgi:predicted nucleic acid-binding Zn ribbon protein